MYFPGEDAPDRVRTFAAGRGAGGAVQGHPYLARSVVSGRFQFGQLVGWAGQTQPSLPPTRAGSLPTDSRTIRDREADERSVDGYFARSHNAMKNVPI